MKQPFDSFAARLMRDNEADKFIEGLVTEYHLPIEVLEAVVKKLRDAEQVRLAALQNRLDHIKCDHGGW